MGNLHCSTADKFLFANVAKFGRFPGAGGANTREFSENGKYQRVHGLAERGFLPEMPGRLLSDHLAARLLLDGHSKRRCSGCRILSPIRLKFRRLRQTVSRLRTIKISEGNADGSDGTKDRPD
ncbi:hypothetical protein [Leisingera sp. JC11]|uniref:hypothetical protein n=1 Tax=Leisingera sp. JC11 TaxID=3042469 RepID=UPI0034530CF4